MCDNAYASINKHDLILPEVLRFRMLQELGQLLSLESLKERLLHQVFRDEQPIVFDVDGSFLGQIVFEQVSLILGMHPIKVF